VINRDVHVAFYGQRPGYSDVACDL
jgi:hypothetical protein